MIAIRFLFFAKASKEGSLMIETWYEWELGHYKYCFHVMLHEYVSPKYVHGSEIRQKQGVFPFCKRFARPVLLLSMRVFFQNDRKQGNLFFYKQFLFFVVGVRARFPEPWKYALAWERSPQRKSGWETNVLSLLSPGDFTTDAVKIGPLETYNRLRI